MLALLFLLLQVESAPAAVVGPTSVADSSEIVIRAKRLADAKASFEACQQRKCSPKEDIAASLAYAETQFLAGEYRASRNTLREARHRNARYAKDLPTDVADLMRANGNLASLTGFTDSARINAIDSLDVLKDAFAPGDAHILAQRLAVGDQFARQGRLDAALQFYERVENRAHRSNERYLEAHALAHRAVLLVAVALEQTNYTGDARRAIARLEALDGADRESFRIVAAALERTLKADGEPERAAITAAASAGKATPAGQDPVLVYARPIEITERLGDVSRDMATEWADIGFRVMPSGAVGDIRTIRRSRDFGDAYLKLIRDAIASRIYRPIASPAGAERVERYSLIHDEMPDGRISKRSATPRLQMTDLTAEPTG